MHLFNLLPGLVPIIFPLNLSLSFFFYFLFHINFLKHVKKIFMFIRQFMSNFISKFKLNIYEYYLKEIYKMELINTSKYSTTNLYNILNQILPLNPIRSHLNVSLLLLLTFHIQLMSQIFFQGWYTIMHIVLSLFTKPYCK